MHIRDWIPNYEKALYGEAAWILPDQNIRIIPSMEHVKWLNTVPELSAAYCEYQTTVDNNADYVCYELSNLDDDEHPAMHRFDGIDDDARDTLLLAAYELGYIRFGYYDANRTARFLKKSNVEVHYILEATGDSKYLESLKKYWNILNKDLPITVYHYPVVRNKRSYHIFDIAREVIITRDKG